ncbi:MAG: DUF3037 domain-containing protein [Waterburya sp.]
MASRYSIIQYVPNPIADERINIGVVAFNDQLVKTRFVKSWKRVRCFATDESDIDYLQEFTANMQKLASLGLLFTDNIKDKSQNFHRLTKIARSWGNSVQFTEPKGSLEDPETLLKDIFEDLLIEPPATKTPTFRDRQAAAKVVRNRVREALKNLGKEAEEYFKKNYELQGELSKNKFDVAVANGKPFLAAQGISFEVQITEQIISSTSWIVSDVKKMQPNTPLGVIMLPPKAESSYFEQAKKTYEDSKRRLCYLGAEIIEENDVESWTVDRLGKEFRTLIS